MGEASGSARSRSGATRPPTRRARDTTAGAQTYDDLYADTRKWVREDWIDYIVPQVYWNIGFAPADYDELVPWWADQVRGTDVHLYIGEATYKVGTSTQAPRLGDPAELTQAPDVRPHVPEVEGNIYFSAKDVRADRLGHMDRVRADHYRHPAIVPVTAGVPGRAPRPVSRLAARRTTAGVAVTWRGSGSSYAVYRVAGRADRCTTADASHLVATVHADGRGTQRYVDRAPVTGRVTYVVTALDRAYRESRSRATHRCCTNRS